MLKNKKPVEKVVLKKNSYESDSESYNKYTHTYMQENA
jgi:hypothetical protein